MAQRCARSKAPRGMSLGPRKTTRLRSCLSRKTGSVLPSRDRRKGLLSRSLGAKGRPTRENVRAALLVNSAFALEHLEYDDVLGVERITLDLLEVHRLQPA